MSMFSTRGPEDPDDRRAPVHTGSRFSRPQGGEADERGLLNKYAMGAIEPILRVAKNLNAASPARLLPGDFNAVEEPARERMGARVQEAKQAGVKPSPLTEIPSRIAVGVPAAMITKNPALAAGIEGAYTSDADDIAGVGFDAGLNALGGKITGDVMKVVGDVASPIIDPAVRLLQKQGVRLTPGQVFGGAKKRAEDINMSQPGIANRLIEDRNTSLFDFDRGAANRALMPIGVQLPASVKTGHEAVAHLEDLAEKRYQAILPKLTFKVDRRLMTGVSRAHAVVGALDRQTADQFNSIMAKYMRFDANGESFGRPLVQMIRGVRDDAYKYLKSDDPTQRTLGEALMKVNESVRSTLRAQNPTMARELAKTDKLYQGARIVSDAASRATDGVSGVAQLSQAVRRADPSKNARKTGQGKAYMQDYSNAGAKVIPSKVGDSGSGPRLQAHRPIQAAKGALARGRYEIDKALLPFTSREAGPVGDQIAAALRKNPALSALFAKYGGAGLLGLSDQEPRQ